MKSSGLSNIFNHFVFVYEGTLLKCVPPKKATHQSHFFKWPCLPTGYQPQQGHRLMLTQWSASLALENTETDQKQEEKVQRTQWVRAAIIGANDGLLSTTSLMLGVGAAKEADRESMVLSGLAGAIAGACNMAVGEFVSVSTQKEIEQFARRRRQTSNSAIEDATKNERQQTSTTCTDPKHQHMLAMLSPARPPALKVLAEIKISEDHGVLGKERRMEHFQAQSKPRRLLGWRSYAGRLCHWRAHLINIVTLAVVTSVPMAVFAGLGAHLGAG